MLDNTDTIYVLLDNHFRIVSYNQRAVDFAVRELHHSFRISENFIDYFASERRAALLEWMSKVITGEHINYEISYPKPDGSFTWYYVRMFPISNGKKEVLGIMTAVSDITQKKLLEQEILNQKVQEQKKITRAVIKAQEKERNKIGQELHDNVNQILASSKMYLCTSLVDKVIERDLIVESIGLIDTAIEEIRLLSKNQITPQRKLGLRELILLLVDRMNENASIKTRFDYQVGSHHVETDLKLNIYRIIQEQITNILKHAQASNVSILLRSDSQFIDVCVADDGKGFQPFKKRSGIGITNMINRIESFNGEFSIESSPGKGCKLSIRIPL
jgi:PAS domain S-box-containing protein